MQTPDWTSTYWSKDNLTVTIEDLLEYTKNIPVTNLEVDVLLPCINHKELDKHRVNNSNLEWPVLVIKRLNSYQLLDGWHRLQKAINNKSAYIKAKVIQSDNLPETFKTVFN